MTHSRRSFLKVSALAVGVAYDELQRVRDWLSAGRVTRSPKGAVLRPTRQASDTARRFGQRGRERPA